jgi:CheY-like chemotaxis protein
MTVAILVVDDEPDVVELFSQRFRREVRREQCALHFAGTCKEALDLLGADLATDDTVVLIDIGMPDMSGHDLMAEVKRRWPDLPAFMVTAFAGDDNRRQAAAAGADEFVTKPVDFDELKSRVQSYRPWGGTG